MSYFRYKYSAIGTWFGRRNAGTDYSGGGVYLRGVQGERIQPQKGIEVDEWEE